MNTESTGTVSLLFNFFIPSSIISINHLDQKLQILFHDENYRKPSGLRCWTFNLWLIDYQNSFWSVFLWRDPSVHRLVVSPLCDTVCLLNHQKWRKCSVSIKVRVWCWSWAVYWMFVSLLVLQVINILICKRQHEVNSTVFNLKRKKLNV